MIEAVKDLLSAAGALATGHQQLLDRVCAIVRPHGVDVLELQPTFEGSWLLRVRLIGGVVAATANVCDPPPLVGVPLAPPDPPYLSPARTSPPFVGDGTSDLMAMIVAADSGVRLPPARDVRGTGEWPLLSEDGRLTMLAGTIAGDAFLSLQHLGFGADAERISAATAQAREQYRTEVTRAGVADQRADAYLEAFEAAAARARLQILDEG